MKDWKFHCAVLGVSEKASLKEIRRAFRQQALARHPDHAGDNTRATVDFQQLHESYQFLLEHFGEPRAREAKPPPAQAPTSSHSPRAGATPPQGPVYYPPARREAIQPPGLLEKRLAWLNSPGRLAMVAAAICVLLLISAPEFDRMFRVPEAPPRTAEKFPEPVDRPVPAASPMVTASDPLAVLNSRSVVTPPDAGNCELTVSLAGQTSSQSYSMSHSMGSKENCRSLCSIYSNRPQATGMAVRCAWRGRVIASSEAPVAQETAPARAENTSTTIPYERPRIPCLIAVYQPGSMQKPYELNVPALTQCFHECKNVWRNVGDDAIVDCAWGGYDFSFGPGTQTSVPLDVERALIRSGGP